MPAMNNRPWAELLQLVPAISLALPFIVAGRVDISQAETGFVVAALLSLAIGVLLRFLGHPQNPIAIGAALWFWLGMLSYALPIEAGIRILSATQAWGLFVTAFIAGVFASLVSPYGYVAVRSENAAWIRKTSLVLVWIHVGCLIWAWFFRDDVRLGGGLPFVVLNAARRILGMRAPRPTSQAKAA